ncbi:MAG: hypothetical protein R3C97_03170 [Geminicoccaceae bacterium]
MSPRRAGIFWVVILSLLGWPPRHAEAGPLAPQALARQLRIDSDSFRGELDPHQGGELALSAIEAIAPWHEGTREVSGYFVEDLAQSLSLEGEEFLMHLPDGSIIGLPLAEVIAKGGFIALSAPESRRVHSPFSLVFPLDPFGRSDPLARIMAVRGFEKIEFR